MPRSLAGNPAAFGFFPEGVEFFEGAILQPATLLVDGAFDLLEALGELADGAVQEVFGLQPLVPGEIDGGEKKVAQFFLEVLAIAGRHGVFQLVQFLLDLGDDVFDVVPVEADADDFLLHFLGFHQGR